MAIESDAFHRVVAAKPADAREEAFERALRPRMLDEYVGQEKVRGQLSIFIEAARKRNEALDHVLLFGPPHSYRAVGRRVQRSRTRVYRPLLNAVMRLARR